MNPASDRTSQTIDLFVVGSIFCVSGVSALIYQVAWQRILALHSGVGMYSVAVIVAAFLAGIGLGSYAGGVLSRRMAPLRALRTFAALELSIGVFGLISCSLYYDLLFLRFPGIFSDLWRAALFHFGALLIPTTLMGMSLPFLVQGMVRNSATAPRTIGYLYGVNVLGAALGALAAPWVLIRLWGIAGAVRFGAMGNLLAGGIVLALGVRLATGGGEQRPLSGSTTVAAGLEAEGRQPFQLWVWLYAVSGFCALSLEILWFRIMDVAVKSTAFTFGTVLAIFLLGLGVGSLVGAPFALRLKQPLRTFLTFQCALIGYSGLMVLLIVWMPDNWPLFGDLVDYWRQYEEFQYGLDWNWSTILGLYFVLPLLLYGPPTVLMGMSFCILQRAVHDDVGTAGFKVGILQAANIAGNVLGSLLAGLLFINLVGTTGTFKMLMLPGIAFAMLGVYYFGARTAFSILAPALAVLLIALPNPDVFWARLHGLPSEQASIGEDATAVGAITQDNNRLRVSINGKGHSMLPFGGIHSELGVVPVIIHPAPVDVAIIGLGSADTAWAAGCRKETRNLRVFEIVRPLAQLLAGSLEQYRIPDLQSFLADPRLTITIADGRNALAVEDQLYDVLEADALRPHSAYSGNLYSLEFFELCARKLKPGGIMCAWAPTPRVHVTFREAFPHVLELSEGQILVGSLEPIELDLASWLDRLESPHVSRYLNPPIRQGVERALRTATRADRQQYGEVRANHDLFPRDEFRSPYPRDAAIHGINGDSGR